MFENVHAALRRIQSELAQVLDPEQIGAVCREVGHTFRQHVLGPVTTIHLFVLQVLHGNCAIARLKDFTDKVFSEWEGKRVPCTNEMTRNLRTVYATVR